MLVEETGKGKTPSPLARTSESEPPASEGDVPEEKPKELDVTPTHPVSPLHHTTPPPDSGTKAPGPVLPPLAQELTSVLASHTSEQAPLPDQDGEEYIIGVDPTTDTERFVWNEENNMYYDYKDKCWLEKDEQTGLYYPIESRDDEEEEEETDPSGDPSQADDQTTAPGQLPDDLSQDPEQMPIQPPRQPEQPPIQPPQETSQPPASDSVMPPSHTPVQPPASDSRQPTSYIPKQPPSQIPRQPKTTTGTPAPKVTKEEPSFIQKYKWIVVATIALTAVVLIICLLAWYKFRYMKSL